MPLSDFSRRASQGERPQFSAPKSAWSPPREGSGAPLLWKSVLQMTRRLHTRREYMKQTRLLVVMFVLVAASLVVAQDRSVAAASPQSGTAVNSEALPALVRILAPADGQTVPSNFGNLRFELMQPATTGGEPSFLVQLDSADPVHTSSTDYALPELPPGSHSIRVDMVDATNSPIPGGSATVQFMVQSVPQPTHRNALRETKLYSGQMIVGAAPASPIPPELRNDGDIKLPLAGSPLPLLSLIGFGLLIGGAAQAMRKH